MVTAMATMLVANHPDDNSESYYSHGDVRDYSMEHLGFRDASIPEPTTLSLLALARSRCAQAEAVGTKTSSRSTGSSGVGGPFSMGARGYPEFRLG